MDTVKVKVRALARPNHPKGHHLIAAADGKSLIELPLGGDFVEVEQTELQLKHLKLDTSLVEVGEETLIQGEVEEPLLSDEAAPTDPAFPSPSEPSGNGKKRRKLY